MVAKGSRFSVSLTSPLLWHNNFIGSPSPPALNSKFFSSFLGSLSSVLLLNTFCDHIRPLHLRTSSIRRLHSSQRQDLVMPRVRITMAHTRSFASIVLSLWNHLPPVVRSFILSAPLSTSLSRLKSYLFPGTEMHWKRLSLAYTVRSAI